MTFWPALGMAIGQGVGESSGGLLAGAAADWFGLGRGRDMSGQRNRIGELTQGMMRRQLERYGNEMQWAVEDAKKAGLHPLFALGGAANISPLSAIGIPGQSGSGDFATEALVRAGARTGGSIGKAIAQSMIRNNEAEAIKHLSDAKLSRAAAARMGGSPFVGQSSRQAAADMLPPIEEKRPAPARLTTRSAGGKVRTGPAVTPAQEVEDVEGELEAMIHAVGVTKAKRVDPWLDRNIMEPASRLLRSIRRLKKQWQAK